MADFFNNVANWFLTNWQRLLYVALILIFGFIIVKFILALVKRRFLKTKLEKTVQGFILSVLKFILYLILIVCLLSSLGISITGLTVVISAISLAVTLSLQDSLKNLVNGFIIISTKIIREGDWVKIGSNEGTVKDVKMLFTVIQTVDNKRIIIPNSSIIGSDITNFNYYKTRRLDLNFPLPYSVNVDLAKKVILDVVDSCEATFLEPKPTVTLTSLEDSSITMTLKVWVNSADYWDTKWYLIDTVFNELKRNNISIPFNQLEVALVDPNKESYVRPSTIAKAEKHKSKPKEQDDIISTFGKRFKQLDEKEKARRLKYKLKIEEFNKARQEKAKLKKEELNKNKIEKQDKKTEQKKLKQKYTLTNNNQATNKENNENNKIE